MAAGRTLRDVAVHAAAVCVRAGTPISISARARLARQGAAVRQIQDRLENVTTFSVFARVALVANEIVLVDLNRHAASTWSVERGEGSAGARRQSEGE